MFFFFFLSIRSQLIYAGPCTGDLGGKGGGGREKLRISVSYLCIVANYISSLAVESICTYKLMSECLA